MRSEPATMYAAPVGQKAGQYWCKILINAMDLLLNNNYHKVIDLLTNLTCYTKKYKINLYD